MEKEEMMMVTIPKAEYVELLDTRTRVDVLVGYMKAEDCSLNKEGLYRLFAYEELADLEHIKHEEELEKYRAILGEAQND